jgi:hypothetical protein
MRDTAPAVDALVTGFADNGADDLVAGLRGDRHPITSVGCKLATDQLYACVSLEFAAVSLHELIDAIINYPITLQGIGFAAYWFSLSVGALLLGGLLWAFLTDLFAGRLFRRASR